jgi:predicted ATPase/DNA-binding CsgD family transcriptional regulator
MTAPLDMTFVSPVLVSRDRELAAVERTIGHVRSGSGTTLVISGEAGIGKSRLIAEARRLFEQAGSQTGLVLQGNCFEVDRDYPFAPVVDLVGVRPSGVPESANRDSETTLVTSLQDIVDRKASTSGEDLDEHRLFREIASEFGRLARRQPLLLIIEDLHWCDDATLKLLLHLSRYITTSPILLLLSYRTDEVQPSLRQMLAAFDRERRATELMLGPLERSGVDAMLRSVFNQPHPIRSDFLDMMHALTAGNPFFIEEVLRALIAAGDIYYEGGHWVRKETDQLRIPRSVRDAVLRRSSELSPAAREVLSLAAVSGRQFEFGVLQDVTGMDEPALLSCMHELIESQLIYEESADRFAFRHALTRQAAYSELLQRECRRLHRVVAEAIERLGTGSSDHRLADLSYHFDAAAVWKKSYEYAREAGERALSLFAPKAAADHFTRALRAAQQLSIQPDPGLFQRRAQAYATLGQFDLADRDYAAMLSLARDHGDRSLEWEALLGLGDLWTGRDYDRSGSYFQEALDLAREIDDPRAIARSLVQIGNWQVNTEQVEEAEQSLIAALSMFEELDDQAGIAEARDLLGVVADLSGDQRLMRERYEEAAELYRALDNRKGVASVQANNAMTAGGYLLFETISLSGGISASEAESSGMYVANLARDIDWSAGEAFALLSLALHCRAQGDYDRALNLGRRGFGIAGEIEHSEWMVVSRIVLGCIHTDLLDFHTAGDFFEQAATQARESGSILWQRGTAGFLATTRILEGKLDEAAEIVRAVSDDLPMSTIGQRMVWLARARLALALGDASTALEIIDRLFATARNYSGEHDIPLLARLRGDSLVALQRFDEAERSLTSARSGATTFGLQPLLWQIHLALGRLYQVTGRPDDATAEFIHARDIVENLSASIPEPSLRDEFRSHALAVIPEKRESTSDLTPREQEVAELVGTGMSNREIADALFIGERTVETHVGNILAKLGFTSRTQVAAWLAGSRLEDPAG